MANPAGTPSEEPFSLQGDRRVASRRSASARDLLRIGVGIKRWLVVLTLGVSLMGLGIGYFLREIYESYSFPDAVWYVTLQFLPRAVRGLLFVAIAVGTVGWGIAGLARSLLAPYRAGKERSYWDDLLEHRYGRQGPRIVAIGGGTGLSVLLRGLKEYTPNLTAVVTVADDGGSSGRLRRELGVLPPGDFRNCIAALADAEPLVTRLMQYRFPEGSGLEGHSFGNLYIVAMMGVVGNFETAIQETSRVLAVRGQIVPSTLQDVTLTAVAGERTLVRGESKIPESGLPISSVALDPPDAEAHPAAVAAILDADMIVLGPGSLYTSIMPNLLVEGITRAIRESRALKVLVCNVATQPGETDGYSAEDHVAAINRHVGDDLFQHLVLHDTTRKAVPADGAATPVVASARKLEGLKLHYADVVNPDNPLRHDPYKLAEALLALVKERPQHDQSNGGGQQAHQTHTTAAAGQQRPRAGTLSRVLTTVAAWQRGLLPVQK